MGVRPAAAPPSLDPAGRAVCRGHQYRERSRLPLYRLLRLAAVYRLLLPQRPDYTVSIPGLFISTDAII